MSNVEQRLLRDIQRLLQARDWPAALAATESALRVRPASAPLHVLHAQALVALGRRLEALGVAQTAERLAPHDASLQDAVGTICSLAGDQPRALRAYDRAVSLSPQHAHYRFNRAAVRRFVGDLSGAEQDYDLVIAARPLDFEAYLNRSELRRQTPASNHVAEIDALLARPLADWRGEVQLRYALAKEYEDLGEYGPSFEQLKRGADRRREHLTYDVTRDVMTVDWIMEAFPAPFAPEGRTVASPASPIFIVGLPRSGTTLLERILASHSEVSSAGELDCFALAVVAAVAQRTPRLKLQRRELVAHSAEVDFPSLGEDYLRRVRRAFAVPGRFIDKMPLNYLYCGLIRRALPDAKIIHVTRHPLAAGYAMYKTLFKDAYPFSYDLGEIGQYYVAYRRLMQHWLTTLPDAVYELNYERLVADQLGETRKVLDYCGLPWQDSCARFHENPDAATTASAVQIRRPIYDTSVTQWQHYEAQLAPLRSALTAAGIAL